MKKMILGLFTAVILVGCTNNTGEERGSGRAEETGTLDSEEAAAPAPKEQPEVVVWTAEEHPKAYYLQELERTDMALTKLEKSYKTGSTSALKAGEAESLRRWDKTLNEIYGALKKQLTAEEMEPVRQKQREWIVLRDQKAEEAASEYEDGTLAGVAQLTTQKQLTKERCYFLANTFLSESK